MKIDKIVCNNDASVYVAIGYKNEGGTGAAFLLQSSDGETWQNTPQQFWATSSKLYLLTDLCYAHGKFWCIVFSTTMSLYYGTTITNGELVCSENGFDWLYRTDIMSTAGACGVIDGRLWVKDCVNYNWWVYNEDTDNFGSAGFNGAKPYYFRPAIYCDEALAPMEWAYETTPLKPDPIFVLKYRTGPGPYAAWGIAPIADLESSVGNYGIEGPMNYAFGNGKIVMEFAHAVDE